MRWLIDDSIRYKQSGSFEDVVYSVRYCFEETEEHCRTRNNYAIFDNLEMQECAERNIRG